MPAVITLGELLIDFVSTRAGVSLEEAPAFEKAAGGAPANVAVGTARLGVTSAFLGKVGEDAFGRFLARTLKENGVDISGLCFSREARTMLAFVSLQASGERDFEFYRSPSADILYTPEEVHTALLQQARVFHFGSISLISEPSRSATLYAVETARQAGALISYDPNLRLNLWADEHAAREGPRDQGERGRAGLSERDGGYYAGCPGAVAPGVEAACGDPGERWLCVFHARF